MKNKEKSKKKRSKKMLFIIPAVIILGIVGLYLYADNAPVIFKGYNDNIETGGTLEAKYMKIGGYTVKK